MTALRPRLTQGFFRAAVLACVVAGSLTACGGESEKERPVAASGPPSGIAIVAVGADEYGPFSLKRWQLSAASSLVRLNARLLVDDDGPVLIGDQLLLRPTDGTPLLLDVRTGEETQLELPPGALAAVPTQDGSMAAFTTGSCTSPTGAAESLRIFGLRSRGFELVKPSLSTTEKLVTVSPAAWSRDGAQLAFVMTGWSDKCERDFTGSDLYVLNLNTNTTKRVGSASSIRNVAFDASGRWLASIHDGDLEHEVHITDLETDDDRTAAAGGDVRAGPLAWSPTQPVLVYWFDNKLTACDASSGRKIRLDSSTDQYGTTQISGFSRDGTSVAYTASTPATDLQVVTLDGRTRSSVPLPTEGYVAYVWAILD